MVYNFECHVNPNYHYTFVLADLVTGEVRTSSCDYPQYPLKDLYAKFDGIVRECRNHRDKCHVILAKANTNEIIAAMNVDFRYVEGI